MHDDGEGTHRHLASIARALGLPVQAFFDRADDAAAGPSEAEVAELVGLFRELRGADLRRRCLDLVRAMARPSEQE